MKDVDQAAVTSTFDDLFTALVKEQAFEWTSVAQFCKDNMGTFVSIVDSTWTLVLYYLNMYETDYMDYICNFQLKGNFGLVMTLLLELVRLVFLSSSSVVNFVVSIVIYFTALFYLLTNSGRFDLNESLLTQTYKFSFRSYLPVELMSNYGTIFGTSYGNALDKAITRWVFGFRS
jgi:hypothetical protein